MWLLCSGDEGRDWREPTPCAASARKGLVPSAIVHGPLAGIVALQSRPVVSVSPRIGALKGPVGMSRIGSKKSADARPSGSVRVNLRGWKAGVWVGGRGGKGSRDGKVGLGPKGLGGWKGLGKKGLVAKVIAAPGIVCHAGDDTNGSAGVGIDGSRGL